MNRKFFLHWLMLLISYHIVFVPLFSYAYISQDNDFIAFDILYLCREELYSDPQKFRSGLKNEISQILNEDIKKAIPNLINNYWAQYKVDDVLVEVTKEVIMKYKNRLSTFEKIKAGLSPSTARDLGTRIANEVLNDPRFQESLRHVIEDTLKDTIKRLEKDIEGMSNIAIECIKSTSEYKGINSTIRKLFIQNFEEGLKKGTETFKASSLTMHTPDRYAGIAGGSLIIASRLSKRIAKLASKRLTGRITSMVIRIVGRRTVVLIPIVGQIIGAVLLAADIKDLTSGESLFANIEKSLTSLETQDKLRQVIITSLEQEFSHEIFNISHELSKSIYVAVKTTVDRMEEYDRILKNNTVVENTINTLLQHGENKKAFQLLDIYVSAEQYGLAQDLERYLHDHEKLDILLELQPYSLSMAKDTKSFDHVFKWYEILNNNKEKFVKAVSLELHKYIDPENFGSQVINKLVDFNNFSTVKFLVENTNPSQLKNILLVESFKLEKFLSKHGSIGLKCLIDFSNINPLITDEFVSLVLENEKRLYILCKNDIKDYALKHPQDLKSIVEVFESRNNILSKIKIFIGAVFGIYPFEIVKLVYPMLGNVILIVQILLGISFIALFSIVIYKTFRKILEKKKNGEE
ncbi:hypothetical protein JCM9492_13220 [Aquifex pyrophilus]